MTTPAPTVVKTICADEIRDVTHYCHVIAPRAGNRDSHFSGFAAHEPVERQLLQQWNAGAGGGDDEMV